MRLVVLAAVVLAAGCGDGMAPVAQLAAAQTRWSQHGLGTYSYVLGRTCECLPAMTGPVTVHVRDRVVVSRVYTDGSPVPESLHHVFPDVPGMFALIADAIERRPARIDITYDSHRGYPSHVFVDFDAMMADEEMSYVASLHQTIDVVR